MSMLRCFQRSGKIYMEWSIPKSELAGLVSLLCVCLMPSKVIPAVRTLPRPSIEFARFCGRSHTRYVTSQSGVHLEFRILHFLATIVEHLRDPALHENNVAFLIKIGEVARMRLC